MTRLDFVLVRLLAAVVAAAAAAAARRYLLLRFRKSRLRTDLHHHLRKQVHLRAVYSGASSSELAQACPSYALTSSGARRHP